MVTIVVSSRYLESDDVVFWDDYQTKTEEQVFRYIDEHWTSHIFVTPAADCAFRKYFIDPHLKDDYIVEEGYFLTTYKGMEIPYKLMVNPNLPSVSRADNWIRFVNEIEKI